MGAIADVSDLINLATGGGAAGAAGSQNIFFAKDARVGAVAAQAPVAGKMSSLWQYIGQPSDGAAPTTVAIPDNTTTGGLRQDDPGGGRQRWITGDVVGTNTQGTLILYDRLLHIGGLDGTLTTAQTVGGTLTRHTDGIGVQAWVEVYTQIGATSRTITMSYTNDAGTAGQTSQATAIGNTGFREPQRLIQLPLASGDKGIKAVASVTLSASTGTVGNFGVTLAYPLITLPVSNIGAGGRRNLISGTPGLVELLTDVCLAWMWFPQGTTIPAIFGNVQIFEK